MNIKLVKLRDGGFKGIELHHFVDRFRNNKPVPKLQKEYPKDPVHKDLQNLFAELREPLLSACGYLDSGNEDVAKYLVLETEVTGIEFSTEDFVIHGRKRVFHDKFIKLSTCPIEEMDMFDKYFAVKEIIGRIIDEVQLYVDGSKKVSDAELVINWIEAGREKDLTPEGYSNMSPEEQREYHTRILEEKFGSMVTNREDMDFDNIEEKELGDEPQQLLLPEKEGESVLIDAIPEKVKRVKNEAKDELF